MRGVFITFEGPEGSGKTTQSGRLCSRLREAGIEVVATREPGGTRTGELIREILQHERAGEPLHPEAEVLLFAASRAQLVRDVIRPALQRGACVISDRFADSTTAYQGYGRGFDLDQILAINAFAMAGISPDLTLLLDVDVASGVARMRRRNTEASRPQDRFEREDAAFHEKVRAGYLATAKRFPERIRILDTTREPDAVAGDIWRIVSSLLAERGMRGAVAGSGG
jgi:dTMP kinase